MTAASDPSGKPAVPERLGPSSPGEIFRAFSLMAMLGFGGVMPWAHNVLVDRRRWLTAAEFVDLLALSQIMPGPNICNLAIMYGDREFGPRGALAALVGVLMVPFVIVVGICALYWHHAADARIDNAMHAMAAVAAGMVLSMAWKIARTLPRRLLPIATCAIAFVAIAFLRVPMVWVVAVVLPLALALNWRSGS